jgi:hypothetical protein
VRRTLGVLSTLCLLVPAGVGAQMAWDVPSLLRPGAPSGLSVLLLDPGAGSELGVAATWRDSRAPAGIGFRAGLANGPDHDLGALFGVDVSGSLGTSAGSGEPSVMWWSGAGVGVGHHARISVPAGLVLGWEARDEGVSFAPYVGAHVAVDALTAGNGDMRLDGALDLGLDLAFDSGWVLRFGAAVGGRDALAVGVRLPGA